MTSQWVPRSRSRYIWAHAIAMIDIGLVVIRLDDRLKDLESQLDSADEPTRRILQQSAELWLGGKQLEKYEDDENGPIKRKST